MKTANEKTLRALIDANAVRDVRVVAQGARFHVMFETSNDVVTAVTNRNQARLWASLDGAARWLRNLGVGHFSVDMSSWSPRERALRL